MKQIRIATLLALSSLIILAGCSGRIHYPSYYTLNLPAPPDPPAAEDVKATVAIREFTAPAYIRRGAIRVQNVTGISRFLCLSPLGWFTKHPIG